MSSFGIDGNAADLAAMAAFFNFVLLVGIERLRMVMLCLAHKIRDRLRAAQARGLGAQHASSSNSPQLSERSEQSERSEFCGARPRSEQRSAVGAKRRPLQHGPAPGT